MNAIGGIWGRIESKIAAMVALILFITLVGTGAGYALWSTSSSVSGSLRTGEIGVSQSGFAGLETAYTSSALSRSTAVVVTNSGSVTAPFSLALSAQTPTPLASAVDLWIWSVPSPSACTPAAAQQGAQADWTTVPTQTGSLAPAAQAVFCIRTSVTLDDIDATRGASVTGILSLSSTLGSWSSVVSATAVQSTSDVNAPSVPGAPKAGRTSGYSTALEWAPATDDVRVSAYDVYRDGVFVATVTTPAFSDETLNAGTTYNYSVRARDAAGNVSIPSSSTAVTTLSVSSTTWYRVIGEESKRCIDAENASTADGTRLIIWDCNGGTNQSWKFVPTRDGYYKVVSESIATSGWTVEGDGPDDQTPIRLNAYSGAAGQQWQIIEQSPGELVFVSKNAGKCFDLQANQTPNGTVVQQYSCNRTTAQSFRLAVN